MYNENIKLKFLKSKYINKNTIKNSIQIFKKAEILEDQYKLDLYNFNLKQLYNFLRILDCDTHNALRKSWSIAKKYIEWASHKDNFYCFPNENIQYIHAKDLKNFISKNFINNQYIINREELYKEINNINNFQDKVILILLYEGVRGNDFEELKNLRGQNCNYNKGQLILRRNNGILRIVNNIDIKSMDIILGALNQKEYYKGNGKTYAKCETLQLISSDKIIRPSERKDNKKEISTVTIDARIRNIQKWIKKPLLTANNIFYSGMFNKLEIIEKERELTRQDYIDIYERFGMNLKGWYILKEKYLYFKECKNGKNYRCMEDLSMIQ